MARDPSKAALALHRFGFGPRQGMIASIASDPQGAVLAELEQPRAGQIVNTNLLGSAARAKLARRGMPARQLATEPAMAAAEKPDAAEATSLPVPQQIFLAEA